MDELKRQISACDLCRDRFAATATAHAPRPVFWANANARILIAGQAPGARVHDSGKPFTDPSGNRLRDWLGMSDAAFYDRTRVAIIPMAFCFPGYDVKGADIPPPPLCARTWHTRVMAELGAIRLRVLVGGAAIKWHLGHKGRVTDAVRHWQAHAPHTFVLPHPSWRNTGWLKREPWFEQDVVPALRARVRQVLEECDHDD